MLKPFIRNVPFSVSMTACRVLRLFIGTRFAARVFGFRTHWVRDAKLCGYSKI